MTIVSIPNLSTLNLWGHRRQGGHGGHGGQGGQGGHGKRRTYQLTV